MERVMRGRIRLLAGNGRLEAHLLLGEIGLRVPLEDLVKLPVLLALPWQCHLALEHQLGHEDGDRPRLGSIEAVCSEAEST